MAFHNLIRLWVVSAVLGISILSIRGTGKKHDIVRHNRLIKNYTPAENATVVKGVDKVVQTP